MPFIYRHTLICIHFFLSFLFYINTVVLNSHKAISLWDLLLCSNNSRIYALILFPSLSLSCSVSLSFSLKCLCVFDSEENKRKRKLKKRDDCCRARTFFLFFFSSVLCSLNYLLSPWVFSLRWLYISGNGELLFSRTIELESYHVHFSIYISSCLHVH